MLFLNWHWYIEKSSDYGLLVHIQTSVLEKTSLLTVSVEQAVILQPIGDKGIAVIGGDTIRGFSTADQVNA